jgi:uncharacterized membrane protein YdbT with pleckstrin-like domain
MVSVGTISGSGARAAAMAAASPATFPRMDLVEGENILWEGRPCWRAQMSFFALWIPLALVPAILAIIFGGGATWYLLSLILVAGVILVSSIFRWSTLYVLTDERLRVRRGILSRKEKTARFDRIQNVSVEQTLLDRIFRVGAVNFETAGTDERDSGFNFIGISDPQQLVRIVAQHSAPSSHSTGIGL